MTYNTKSTLIEELMEAPSENNAKEIAQCADQSAEDSLES